MAVTQPADISAVTPVDAKGRFDKTVPDYAGQHVFDANPQIIRDLKNQGRSAAANGAVLLRHETYEHSYETVSPGPWSDAKGHCFPGSTLDPQAPQYAVPCKPPNAFTWGVEVMKFFEAHPKK